jgi:hypothetical protein
LLFSLQNLTFDVKDILSGNENVRKLLEKYQSDSNIPVTEKDRNSIINIVLGYVINEIGHYYPKLPTKEKLAAAIVAAFLQMGLVPSHANIYSSATANKHCEMDGIKGGAIRPGQTKSRDIFNFVANSTAHCQFANKPNIISSADKKSKYPFLKSTIN